jgi:hypothetical protein
MTEPGNPVWRPPLILRAIAAIELGSGAVLGWLFLELIVKDPKLTWPIQIVFEAVVAGTILAGVTLWKGEPPGFLASCIIQLLQIVRIVAQPYTFGLLLGPSVTLAIPTGGSPHVLVELRAALSLFAKAPDGAYSPC